VSPSRIANDFVTEPTALAAWRDGNQRYLTLALARLRATLEKQDFDDARLSEAAEAMPSLPALETTVEVFGLSPFERDILLMCAGVELDASFASLCVELRGGGPAFGFALATLPQAHWSALSAAAPLRYWRLIELGAGGGLTTRELRIDERILHHLIGLTHVDERLAGLVDHVVETHAVGASHERLAEQVAAIWARPTQEDGRPVIELLGNDGAAKAAVASLACAQLGARLLRMSAAEIPMGSEEREQVALLWEREALLTGAVLLLDADDLADSETRRVTGFVQRLRAPLIVGCAEPLQARRLNVHRVEVPKPDKPESRELWRAELGPYLASLNGGLEAVLGQFALSLQGIRSASAAVRRTEMSDDGEVGEVLWQACRGQARPRLEGLAERIEPRAGWDDIVLPEPQMSTLQELALHLAQRSKVYGEWGFEAKSSRGLGFATLFAGESGTGKTMAAEVIAGDLGIDLYRIDLSQVVSKYIGETEKNLARVFEAAEDGGAILLFDEADALFGKRSEVKDSHDRYANVEVSYLLQRMETYRGLAILTTNQKAALDNAFLRRLRFVVLFPFPDESSRERIWRTVFPDETPLGDLDFARLARLNLTGGNIRNVALNAAFLAAHAGEPVGVSHIVRAARQEYAKLDRPRPDAELRALIGTGGAR